MAICFLSFYRFFFPIRHPFSPPFLFTTLVHLIMLFFFSLFSPLFCCILSLSFFHLTHFFFVSPIMSAFFYIAFSSFSHYVFSLYLFFPPSLPLSSTFRLHTNSIAHQFFHPFSHCTDIGG